MCVCLHILRSKWLSHHVGLILSQGTTGLWCDVGVEATIPNYHMMHNTKAGIVCLVSQPRSRNCIIAGNGGVGVSLQKYKGTYPKPEFNLYHLK